MAVVISQRGEMPQKVYPMSFSRSSSLVNTRIVNLRSATSIKRKTRTGEFKACGLLMSRTTDVRLSVVQEVDPSTMKVSEDQFMLRMYIERSDDTIACNIDITEALSQANRRGIVQGIDASDINSIMQHLSGFHVTEAFRELTSDDDEVDCLCVFIECANEWRKQQRAVSID